MHSDQQMHEHCTPLMTLDQLIAHVYCLAVTHITDCLRWDWVNKIQTWIIWLYIFPPISCLISYLMTKPPSSVYQMNLEIVDSSIISHPSGDDHLKLTKNDHESDHDLNWVGLTIDSCLAHWWPEFKFTPAVYLFIFTCLWCFRSLTLWIEKSSSKKQVLTSAFLNNLQPRFIPE